MKTAVADANVVNAVSASVREAIHTDIRSSRALYRDIERRGYEERGGIGFRAPGVSVRKWDRPLLRKLTKNGVDKGPRRNPRLFL